MDSGSEKGVSRLRSAQKVHYRRQVVDKSFNKRWVKGMNEDERKNRESQGHPLDRNPFI